MKKTESNNLAEKKTTIEKLETKEPYSLNGKNLNQDQEKTLAANEELEIEDQKSISEQMDEIIKINDKFTLVESILYLLCKELEIPNRSQPGAIGAAIKALYEAHYKSMENWKNITKSVQKDEIRQ